MTLVTMKYVDNVVSGILRIYGKKKQYLFPTISTMSTATVS